MNPQTLPLQETQQERITTFSFCESYIDRLTEYIHVNYVQKKKDLRRLAIVFGGKRPALFIKKVLAQRLKKNFFPPAFFTIDEFLNYSLKKKDQFSQSADLDNCYLLYTLAQKHCPQILRERELFAQFLPWSREILSFIEQLDLEDIQQDALLNIQNNAEIGYAVPESINDMLESIVVLRESYHQTALTDKSYSRALQYLLTAQTIESIEYSEFDEILFCNFFYFHKTEEKIIKNLLDRKQAVLLFQGDQRKWPVLNRIAGTFDCQLYETPDDPPTPQFSLELYNGFDTHSQIGILTEVLKKIPNLQKTVIVLPNPEAIIPLLSQLAHQVKDFNISLGYPLSRSSLYSLFESIFQAQLSRKENRYYAKDYLKVMRHPFVKNLLLSQDPSVTRILIHKIEEILTGKEKTPVSGSLFLELSEIERADDVYLLADSLLDRMTIEVSKTDLKKIVKTLHDLLFKQWEDMDSFGNFADVFERALNVFVEKSFMKNYPLNINIAARLFDVCRELKTSSFADEHFSQEDMFKIFQNQLRHEMVAFHGSPLKGLQVLGLLETRSLNFDHVIIMDVNEGSLPKLNIYEPLIPREVMIGLNLNRLELEEEIQRYLFMRLISSAKTVHLIYQDSKDKEKSRFIQELIWDNEKKRFENPAAKIKQIPSWAGKYDIKIDSGELTIPKTPQMVEYLKTMRYSASSINTYLKDPIEFFYSYVLGLKERDDLLDEPEAKHVGTFVHELLEETFQQFLNKKPNINKAFQKYFFKTFEEKFEERFGRSMKSDAFLLKTVLIERMERFLENEAEGEGRQIEKLLHLEQQFEEVIALPSGKYHFKYIVDRIDQLSDGSIMVVDYKTGGTDVMPKRPEFITAMELDKENIQNNIKSFQIPLYFHYLHKNFPGKSLNACLYNLRSLKLSKFIDVSQPQDYAKMVDIYLKPLDFILAEICDPQVPFQSP